MENFLFGGVSAGLAICIVNPFDVVKSRMQMQVSPSPLSPSAASPKVYKGTFQALTSIAKAEGIQGLYRGLVPAICFQVVGNSVRFGVYYAAKDYLGVGSGEKIDSRTNLALALTAGASAGVIACPFFMLKTQLQVQSSAPSLVAGHQHNHTGMISATRTILKTQGFRGLFTALPAFIPRCTMLVGAQMTTYDYAKNLLLTEKVLEEGITAHIISSAIAAGVACFAMQPFDLVGARIMNQPVDPNSGKPLLYSSPVDCFAKTIKGEGISGLYKGSSANYLRMCPQYILTFVFFEQMMKFNRERKE